MTQTEARAFTEDELGVLVADRVKREMADATAEVEKLRSENTELANKLDAEITARATAEKAAEEAKATHEKFVADLEAEKAALAKKDERIKAMREAAAHLKDEFFTDEKRVERVIAMDDDSFAGYIDDLKAAAPTGTTTSTDAPRETAMEGKELSGGDKKSTARDFMFRSYASKEG